MRIVHFDVPECDNGISALKFLKRRGFSARLVTKLKSTGGLTRGGSILRSIDAVFTGERIDVTLPDGDTLEPNPDLYAAVAYEDEDVVVFDKPPGLPVHPSGGHYYDTLGNLFAAMYTGVTFRPVSRLDRDTSGLCVCAKNTLAAARLAGKVDKVYYAVIDGEILQSGEINAPITRESDSIIKRCVREDGKPAITLYKPIRHANGKTLLEITLVTGRTHQIRAHFAYIGFPLCGDDMYGGDCSEITRQALHCGKVTFSAPISGEQIMVESSLPEDIAKLFGG
ncbi:MAG: RluA family pseudouridine synthase [Ruminococcaceae bacterium]|nr:RluA family pseudouridine synthase [Oscillospiraceae bacterium]